MRVLNIGNFRILFVFVYIVLFFTWVFAELFSLHGILAFRSLDSIRSESVEILLASIGILAFIGLFLELKKAKLRIREAEENLRAYKNRLSLPGGKKIGEEFWRSIKLQFYAWGLSPSEEEIAKLMLRGFSNQQIAANLQKSVRTIENQSFSIYKKSGMTGKLEFIAYFIEALLPEEED